MSDDIEDLLAATDVNDNVMIFTNALDSEHYLSVEDYAKVDGTKFDKANKLGSTIDISNTAYDATAGSLPILRKRKIPKP